MPRKRERDDVTDWMIEQGEPLPSETESERKYYKRARKYLRDECRTPDRAIEVINTWLRLDPADPGNFRPQKFAVNWTCGMLGIAPAAVKPPSDGEKQGDTNFYLQINEIATGTADRFTAIADRIRGHHRDSAPVGEDPVDGRGPDRLELVGQPVASPGGNGGHGTGE